VEIAGIPPEFGPCHNPLFFEKVKKTKVGSRPVRRTLGFLA
jgi:hypothetical protein